MNFLNAKKLIGQAKNIGIVIHIKADGDAIGSGLALYHFLSKLGKKVDMLCSDEISEKYRFLFKNELAAGDKKYDLMICVDCSDYDRMGKYARLFSNTKNTICIDHHKTNNIKATEILINDILSSCAELIYEFMCFINKKIIDKQIAGFIYVGIITDSGAFYYPQVSSDTHKIVSELFKFGINGNELYGKVFRLKSMKTFLIQSRVVPKVKFFDNNKIGILTFRISDFEATGTNMSYTEGAINSIQDIEDIKVSVSITEVQPDIYKISFRSSPSIDVSYCAGVFGGGGHINASGCQLTGAYEEILEKILKVVRDVI